MYKLGVIGVGNMGGAIIRGILNSNTIDPKDIIIFERNKDKVSDLIEKKVTLASSEEELIKDSKFILLSIKPQSFKELGNKVKGKIKEDSVLVSIAAGVSLKEINEIFNHKKNIRVMPNTPALVGAGMSGISPNDNVSEVEKNLVLEIFSSIGEVTELDEKKIDAYSAVAGCMPAFVYMFIEAAADSGVKNGLKRDEAYKYVAQTVLGSAKMVLESDKHPGELKDQVTSPGGTTIRGVLALEENGFRNAVIKAVDESANAKIDI